MRCLGVLKLGTFPLAHSFVFCRTAEITRETPWLGEGNICVNFQEKNHGLLACRELKGQVIVDGHASSWVFFFSSLMGLRCIVRTS